MYEMLPIIGSDDLNVIYVYVILIIVLMVVILDVLVSVRALGRLVVYCD